MVELRELEAQAREIGGVLGEALTRSFGKRKVGFALLLFDFGEGGHMTYVSNAQREDMLAAFREMFEKLSH